MGGPPKAQQRGDNSEKQLEVGKKMECPLATEAATLVEDKDHGISHCHQLGAYHMLI